MLPVINYINDILHNNNDNLYNIITQIDFDGTFDKSVFIQVINTLVEQNIHQQFNLNKYSAYIPIAHKISNVCSNYISKDALYNVIPHFLSKVDIKYTNVIANNIYTKANSIIPSIKNLQFYTMPSLNSSSFNIISFQNHITCNITFNSSVIADKKRLKRCFLKACRNLII